MKTLEELIKTDYNVFRAYLKALKSFQSGGRRLEDQESINEEAVARELGTGLFENYYPRQGWCALVPNPVYPTTFPFGLMRLVDFSNLPGPESPVFVWGNVFDLPNALSQHAFAIHTSPWDNEDCATAGDHLHDPFENHGFQNWSGTYSHEGDLHPFWTDGLGNHINYLNGGGANKPSLYGSSSSSSLGRSLVVYEYRDNFEGRFYAGKPVACCKIHRFYQDGEKEWEADQEKENKLNAAVETITLPDISFNGGK